MQNEFQLAVEKELANVLPMTTFQADDLMEKLKLLNYEKLLLREMKMKPLSKFYFVKSFNSGEQFFMFTSLCAWLIRKLGKNFEQPQEFDDPNQTIANIVKVLQEIDIPTDFPTNKLIQGAGPICLFVLDCLATQVCKIAKLSLNRLQVKQEEETISEYLDNDAEIILEKLEEEQNALMSDDSDEGGNSLLNLKWRGRASKSHVFDGVEYSDNFTEIENWRLELERVLPQLKVVVKADSRDWRAHLKQMESLKANIEGSTDETQLQLKKLQSDITFAMDKVESREKHLNNDLKDLIKQYKDVSVDLSTVQSAIKDIDNDRNTISRELNEVIHENEGVKSKMEQKGHSMSDGGPILNLKKAIARLKDEIGHMNLEIGLLSHAIDQDILRQVAMYSEVEAMPSIAT